MKIVDTKIGSKEICTHVELPEDELHVVEKSDALIKYSVKMFVERTALTQSAFTEHSIGVGQLLPLLVAEASSGRAHIMAACLQQHMVHVNCASSEEVTLRSVPVHSEMSFDLAQKQLSSARIERWPTCQPKWFVDRARRSPSVMIRDGTTLFCKSDVTVIRLDDTSAKISKR